MGVSISRFDSQNAKSNYFPSDLATLIRAINNLRKNSRLYLKLMTPTRGMYVKGYEYSNLPNSMQNIFDYNSSNIQSAKSDTQSKIKYSTITEYQTPIPAVVTGKKLFKLKIKERTDDQ